MLSQASTMTADRSMQTNQRPPSFKLNLIDVARGGFKEDLSMRTFTDPDLR